MIYGCLGISKGCDRCREINRKKGSVPINRLVNLTCVFFPARGEDRATEEGEWQMCDDR
jgi:hypothetical protein